MMESVKTPYFRSIVRNYYTDKISDGVLGAIRLVAKPKCSCCGQTVEGDPAPLRTYPPRYAKFGIKEGPDGLIVGAMDDVEWKIKKADDMMQIVVGYYLPIDGTYRCAYWNDTWCRVSGGKRFTLEHSI